MPIDLVKPIEGIAKIKKGFEEDKPQEKPMTEYQKQKIEVAKKNQELKSQSLAQKQVSVESVKAKEDRLAKKQDLQAKRTELLEKREERLSKISPITSETGKIKAQTELQKQKNIALAEKRKFQNAKNREAMIKAQQSLSDDILSKKMTREGTLKHLGTLKEGPKPVGFQNINPGGGIENE